MRVHELAKELGLKSQELLDRIQKEGLDVKLSALASLDPSMVERIRSIVNQPSAGKEARGSSSAPAPLPSAATKVESAPPTLATSAPTTATPVRGGGEPLRPAMPGPRPAMPGSSHAPAPQHPHAPSAPPVRPSVSTPGTGPGATPGSIAGTAPGGPAAAPPVQRLVPGSSPSGIARPSAPTPPEDAASANPPRTGPGQAPPANRPGAGLSGPPTARPSGVGGGGPLSAHTRHGHPGGGARPGPSGPPPSQGPRPDQRPAQTPGAPGGQGFQPLRRNDYMPPAGVRAMSPRGSGTTAPPSAPPIRRSGEDSPSDGGRREGPGGPRRPLPQVAAPIVSPPRTGGPQRPPSPAPKSQRPEKSMTRDEMMALMRSGGLNNFQSPGAPPGAGQGGRPGQPQRGTGPGGPPRPSAPPTGPAARRPAPGPGMMSPVRAAPRRDR